MTQMKSYFRFFIFLYFCNYLRPKKKNKVPRKSDFNSIRYFKNKEKNPIKMQSAGFLLSLIQQKLNKTEVVFPNKVRFLIDWRWVTHVTYCVHKARCTQCFTVWAECIWWILIKNEWILFLFLICNQVIFVCNDLQFQCFTLIVGTNYQNH